MKQKTITLLLALSLPTICFAQLKVNSAGNIGIHTNADNSNALKIDGNIHSTGSANFYGGFNTLTVMSNGEANSGLPAAMKINNNLQSTRGTIGLLTSTSNPSDTAKCNIGIFGITSGQIRCTRNFGSIGCIGYNQFGSGVLGLAGGLLSPTYINIDGCYAGFFRGNVKVTGTITGTLLNESDAILKKNIADMGETRANALHRLNLLSPVSYQYDIQNAKDETIDNESDSKTEQGKYNFFEKQQARLAEKTHFGFIAQELQKVYPELVYEQDNGTLAINYVELIPVLVQSIKELNEKVETLSTAQKQKAPANNETVSIQKEDILDLASMSQNSPNPFSERTEIDITLPESVKKAMLYIYDMTGKQMEQHEITGRGNTSMTIYADRMNAGMYIYALVADGKVITSKKMIVTK